MNYVLRKKSIGFLLAGILSLALAACGGGNNTQTDQGNSASDATPTASTDNSLQAIKDRGVIRIAVFSDKPPFGYMDKAGTNQGYDVELAKRIAKDLLGDESKVEYVLVEAQHRVDVLKSNKVDITLANFTVTPERAEQVDFAAPYMKTAIGVVSPKSALITDVAQLDGKKLIVNKGTTAESYFAKTHPAVEQLKYDHNTEAFAALKDGRGVGLAHDNTLLYAWAKENPDFEVALNKVGEDDVIAPAVKKGNTELLNWLNEEIAKLQQEEFFHKAYDVSVKSFYGDNVDANNVVIDASNLNSKPVTSASATEASAAK